ncbi:MAG: PLDc N-terminal domain-containing protein [Nanoarchaeota archaeon]|nr:PLDc N-terminal domain-containing protein [Nanoarchaeota archaeon]
MVFRMIGWLIGIVAMIWVIYDVATQQKKMKSAHKVLWILGAVFFNIIIAIIYYFVVYKKKEVRKKGKRK